MTDIYIFNTATGQKEKFVPIDKNNIRMYVCGPTVYDDIHIGNARPLIVFDVMYRLLKYQYGQQHVTYARNITDIDDKIITRSKEKNITPQQLTDETIAHFHAITAALGCAVDIEPRATTHIQDMVAMIEKLLASGFAYQAEGHVLFDVSKMADYGKFAKRPLDDLLMGARIEVAPYKRSALDFVLWKPAKPGEPSYASPRGAGRPGWHIECSAMAEKHLGGHFDIHGGGQDLIFPHHQNELAQSRGCGHPFANYWMHNGFVLIDGKKMSKSEGNFITVRDLLERQKIPTTVLRLLMLSTHYRQPLDFTDGRLQEAKEIVDKLNYAFINRTFKENISEEDSQKIKNKIIELLGNDLDTISLLAEMHQSIKSFNKDKKDMDICFLQEVSHILGLAASYYNNIPDETKIGGWLGKIFNSPATTPAAGHEVESDITRITNQRYRARLAKDFKKSDELRQEIIALGYAVNDLPNHQVNIVHKSLLKN